ncbi:hypothetical protein IBTHAUMO2_190022 [Nitrosopumilaceae archaeon]|nr:hypothetical protein IBTHAUMO2_190022 [Nitrosopumilaceae archaeon]
MSGTLLMAWHPRVRGNRPKSDVPMNPPAPPKWAYFPPSRDKIIRDLDARIYEIKRILKE